MINIFKLKSTYFYLALSILLFVAALIIGIDDNPPGLILAFISSILLVAAFTNNWKTSNNYILLSFFSILVFVVSVILHNVFETIGGVFFEPIGVLFFLIAIFICPAAIIVGLVGTIVYSLKKMKQRVNDC